MVSTPEFDPDIEGIRLAVFFVACQSVEPIAWPAASLPTGPQPQKLRERRSISRTLHFAGGGAQIARSARGLSRLTLRSWSHLESLSGHGAEREGRHIREPSACDRR